MAKRDEITRNQPCALMDQLIKRMLSVCSGLTPKDRTGVIGDLFSVKGYVLSVTLHRQLLKVRWEPFQILFVGQDRDSLCIKKVGVPNSKQTEENRQVPIKGRRAEMLIHLMEAVEHVTKIVRANREHGRQTDG